MIAWGGGLLAVGLWFFLLPFATTSYYLVSDPGLRGPGGSTIAFKLHRQLSGRYGRYAQRRVASGIAAELDHRNISATEWPLFGSAFYLWATVQLQDAWEADPSLSKRAPKDYARAAIEAATALVLDEGHASWVKTHWGEGAYLVRENVFYRMLLMSAIIAHHQLTGSDEYLPLLRTQVESMAAELDASPHGLLDDYPRQCYPTDVVAALAAIRRADAILGTDHGEILQRSVRGFEGALAVPYGLPPYAAIADEGIPLDQSRGCGNSYFCSFAPEVWPGRADNWYGAYVENFWERGWFVGGFREFPKGQGEDWYFDVDAGPVFGGLGSAASAFGLAACRTNGDYHRAHVLGAEMIAASWPLVNGTLLVPRLVSDGAHAPYLGEMAILFQLSRGPSLEGEHASEAGGVFSLPGCVWLVLGVQLSAGSFLCWRGLRRLRRTLSKRCTA